MYSCIRVPCGQAWKDQSRDFQPHVFSGSLLRHQPSFASKLSQEVMAVSRLKENILICPQVFRVTEYNYKCTIFVYVKKSQRSHWEFNLRPSVL